MPPRLNYEQHLFSSQNWVKQNLQKQHSNSAVPLETSLGPPIENHTQTHNLFYKKSFKIKRSEKWVDNWEIRRMLAWTSLLVQSLSISRISLPQILIVLLRNSTALGRQFSSWVAPLDYNLLGLFIRVPSYCGNLSSSWIQRGSFMDSLPRKENAMTKLVKLSVIIWSCGGAV